MAKYVYLKEINGEIKLEGIYDSFYNAIDDIEKEIASYETICNDFGFEFKEVNSTSYLIKRENVKAVKNYRFIHNDLIEKISFYIFEENIKDKVSLSDPDKEQVSKDIYKVFTQERHTYAGARKNEGHESSSGYKELENNFYSFEEAKSFVFNELKTIKNKLENEEYEIIKYSPSELVISGENINKNDTIYIDFYIMTKNNI